MVRAVEECWTAAQRRSRAGRRQKLAEAAGTPACIACTRAESARRQLVATSTAAAAGTATAAMSPDAEAVAAAAVAAAVDSDIAPAAEALPAAQSAESGTLVELVEVAAAAAASGTAAAAGFEAEPVAESAAKEERCRGSAQEAPASARIEDLRRTEEDASSKPKTEPEEHSRAPGRCSARASVRCSQQLMEPVPAPEPRQSAGSTHRAMTSWAPLNARHRRHSHKHSCTSCSDRRSDTTVQSHPKQWLMDASQSPLQAELRVRTRWWERAAQRTATEPRPADMGW